MFIDELCKIFRMSEKNCGPSRVVHGSDGPAGRVGSGRVGSGRVTIFPNFGGSGRVSISDF